MSKHIDKLVESKLKAIKQEKNIVEVGRVTTVNNYIIEVDGLWNVGYYEMVRIQNQAIGFVNRIRRDRVVVAIVKQLEKINVGDEVVATGQEFAGLYSKDSIGHIVNMFGQDQLNNQVFDDTHTVSTHVTPTPIMERSSVNRPMLTGITGIDMIYPIGRGQRQLILGNKKTGKTQIALDTIVNQRGKDILCIYIAIGKTKKEVKEVYAQLYKRGAMDYTVIVTAFQDECAPVIQHTPFVGLSIAQEYMLKENRDVLVVIDDLKKHADAYRESSILTGEVPGRDAYPSDIFHTHARLLEVGCQHKNGGSITILPIMETKGGDITDYISTNAISITDGQLVLSTKNFEKGYRPAIDYGLSVSRLGGAVQTKEMKTIGAAVRRELLAYLDSCQVYELSNPEEMSRELVERMEQGKQIRSQLKQYKFSPRTLEDMCSSFKEYAK